LTFARQEAEQQVDRQVDKTLIFTLHERLGIDRLEEPVQIGVPLPAGEYHDTDRFGLCTDNDEMLPSAKTISARWHEKSIKWCLLKFCISIKANKSLKIFIYRRDPRTKSSTTSGIEETPATLTVKTQQAEFSLDKNKMGLFEKIIFNGEALSSASNLQFADAENIPLVSSIDHIETRSHCSEDGLYQTEVVIDGSLKNSNDRELLRIQQHWFFYHASDTAKCLLTIHNPAPAIHEGGHWDLGDPNSVLLESAALRQTFERPPQAVLMQAEPDDDWKKLESANIILYQESSGGENWNSPVHLNRNNAIPLELKGYRLSIDSDVTHGDRASPVFSIQTGKNQYFNARVKGFWQNFPKAFAFDKQELSIGLFPEQFPDLHEFQPGEKKTHEILFSLSSSPDDLNWVENPLEVRIDLDWLKNSNALPEIRHHDFDDRLSQIIQLGIDGEDNFFAKREAIDEYGWRNFGDIYADHETLEYQGDDLFVSHYNNQYDPLLGFLYQYLITGESRWFELADDLAKHISDIDIYDTIGDREEYNHGLFWHTDHYVPTTTASHRTYSKNQPKNVYQDHIGGGGPGGQHCYTSGLTLHHLLTGYQQSKHSVEQLSAWITNYYEGSETIADTLLAVRNRKRKDLKNIFTGQYPLDRGTGNYINALLDLYNLNTRQSTLDRAGLIIKKTAHPQENIASRKLDDVENSWYYTIFLQSVIRFLFIKENSAQLDSTFYHIRDILLHYADWMVEHEYPYLDIPEILEYPNVTWVAQDIRKAHIFFGAAYFNPTPGQAFIDQSDFYLDYVANTLVKEKGFGHTRILSILMQNLVPRVTTESKRAGVSENRPDARKVNAPDYVFANTLWSAIKRINLKAEINWISRRSTIAQKLFDKMSDK
jgi:hypothetical protein